MPGGCFDADDSVVGRWPLSGAAWRRVAATGLRGAQVVRGLLAEWQEVKLQGPRCWALQPLAAACPRLSQLSLFQVDLPIIPITGRTEWSWGFQHLAQLVELKMVECRYLNDEVLDRIFTLCPALRLVDVSWSGEFSDMPWSQAPVTLREFYGIGSEHLTERLVVHLSARCAELRVLHWSRHLTWIGSTKWELLDAFGKMTCLEDLALQDLPLDDDLLMALALLPLRRLELWSVSAGCMTLRGLKRLAQMRQSSLKKLSLDSFVFQSAEALQCLARECPALCELLLEGTRPCSMGALNCLHFAQLVKLRLGSCGVAGELDCSAIPLLRYLWLFDNGSLTKINGQGQALEVLNLGSTACQSFQGFDFQHLVMLDLSSLQLHDHQLSEILLNAPLLGKAVLGENFLSQELLLDFLTVARQLKRLSLCSSSGCELTPLSSLVEAHLAENLQLLELYEGSCRPLASFISEAVGLTIIKRVTTSIRLWVVEQQEPASPYGRIHRADESWFPVQ